MKKILKVASLSLVICFMCMGSVMAALWGASESMVVPSWGAMSAPTNTTMVKSSADTYGYINKMTDTSTFAKYGDFVRTSAPSSRISKTYYQIYLNNDTKIHYNDYNVGAGVPVKARVCGSNYEPSAGTRIKIKFSADR